MSVSLQQAIRLIGLSTLELDAEIQQAIEENPMLEMVDDAPESIDAATDEASTETFDHPSGAETADGTSDDLPAIDPDAIERIDDVDLTIDTFEDVSADEIGSLDESVTEEIPADTSWEDVYEPSPPAEPSTTSAPPPEDGTPIEERRSSQETLNDYLQWQLDLTPFSDRDRVIATAIVDSIDDDGMLTADLETLLPDVELDDPIEIDELEAVLKRIQQFDPIGVAARDIRECIELQLTALPIDIPWRDAALELIADYFELLANRSFAELARKLDVSEDDLTAVIALIQTTNPRPASSVGELSVEYIEPDVLVRKVKGRWTVEAIDRGRSRVRVNPEYEGLVQRANQSRDNQFLKNHLQDARFFVKSLDYRSDTLLNVARAIVGRQIDFFEQGEEGMKPMVLADVAEIVGIHESTVSRATTKKYMRTPRGVFELKYFFSSHVGTASGGEVSSTAIRALIKKLVDQENPAKPLSDSKLTKLLGEQNIKVARRTVAKYRESLAIPSSTERKRLV